MRPRLIAQLALVCAAASWCVTAAADYAGTRTFDPGAAVVLRVVLVSVVLVTATWAVLRPHLLTAPRGGLRASAGLGLLLGHALLPTAWQGRAYAAELVARTAAGGQVLDLVAWLVVGGATAWVVTRPAAPGRVAGYAPVGRTSR